MKTLQLLITLFIVNFINAQASVQISDLEPLNNTNWKGLLTYTDYQSGELKDAETTLQIKIENNTVKSNIQYTYEPNKNNKSSVKLKKNGTYYGNEKVIENTYDKGLRTIKTMYEGKDDNRPATMYITHTFNDDTYTVTKFVAYKNSKESLIRNTYKFKKIN